MNRNLKEKYEYEVASFLEVKGAFERRLSDRER